MFVGAGAIVRWLRGGDDDIARDRPSTSLWTLAAFCAVAVILYWEQAAAQRDRIERAAKDDPRVAACDPVALQDLPDNVSGVHLFRNGVTEASREMWGCTQSLDGPRPHAHSAGP